MIPIHPTLQRKLAGAIVASVLAIALPVAQAADVFLKFDSYQPAATAGQMGIAFTQAVQKETEYEIQVSTGKAATKAALDSAKGKVDLYFSSPGINYFMQKGAAMYKRVKNASELHGNLRSLLSFPLGVYHYVTYADTGIRKFGDLKDKTVFVGPPGGVATKIGCDVIRGSSGLECDKDYKLARFDWTSAQPAFSDRQLDLFGLPTNAPAPRVQEWALGGKLHFLDITDDTLKTDELKKVLSIPGRTIERWDPLVYGKEKVTNTGPINVIGVWLHIGTNKQLPEEVGYNMMKAFWKNIDTVRDTAYWMKQIDMKVATRELNIPLHAGAYRYYKEIGFDVPDALKPAEAK
ncbi:MAG: TAXI family TRAP transporter solute-binding subunit [Pseudomonadota bacterium]